MKGLASLLHLAKVHMARARRSGSVTVFLDGFAHARAERVFPTTISRNYFSRPAVTDKFKCACGKWFRPRRSDAEYCSNACRQRAYRGRKYPNVRDEWYTPAWLMALVRQACGGPITLDPASCATAQEVVRAERLFTVKEDGLRQPWCGKTLWLNPPFSNVEPFIEKAVESYDSGKSIRG